MQKSYTVTRQEVITIIHRLEQAQELLHSKFVKTGDYGFLNESQDVFQMEIQMRDLISYYPPYTE